MPSDSPSQPSKKPIRLGKYEVIRHIATGGMGAVYHARDTELGREVALKILPPDLAAKPAMVVRFRREYAAASKMQHENIVALYELGELNQTLYFAMEFVDGIDLYEYVKQNGPLDPEEARQIVLQGARALRHAAEHGIVHRDIKPSNFLLTRKNGKLLVKLTDFGLAREISDDHYRVTRTGTTVGTIDYMSPEQARDSGAADARSDLYSLGGTWFHLLTGQAPFPAGGLGERLIKIMNDPPPDVCALNPRVSPACRAVLERLLAKDPEDRYPSAESLIDDLLSLEGQTSRRLKPTADSPKRNKKRSNAQVHSLEASSTPADSNPWPWIYAGGGAVLALVLLVVVLVASRRGNPDQPVNPGEPIVLLPPVITMPQTPPVPRPQRPTASDKTPSRTALPRLGNAVLDPVALKQEADHPWAKAEPWSAPIRKVRRVSAEPGTFRCLADALAAPGPAIVEIADNGPFFELPIDLGEREVWIRAAPGFRPLLIWDLPATMEKRRLNKKTDQPLYFWRGRSGRLLLEGLDVAWQIPETLAESFVVLDRSAGEVHLRDCTFSSTGKPRERATLLRVVSPDSGSRLRLERCHLRMRGVQLLHLDAPAAHVRIDNCLITSSEATLLLLRNGEKTATHLWIIRSTLAASPCLLELAPRQPEERKPSFQITAWDSILASLDRSGDMITLDPAVTATSSIHVQPCNVLYAGWPSLFRHQARSITSLKDWRDLWVGEEADGQSNEVWPETPEELGLRSAESFSPLRAHAYASSVDPFTAIGHDPRSLPLAQLNWPLWLGLSHFAEDLLEEPSLPEFVPALNEERFSGTRLNLVDIPDLGAYLDRLRRTQKWADRVVLYLSGKGEHITSPIRVRDASLVLVFEEPADKETPRLSLKGTVGPEGALIDLQNGNLELYHATLRLPDLARSGYTQVIRVQKGDLRLHRCRIEGPMQSTPDNYRGAILVQPTPLPDDLPRTVEITDSVLLSGQRGLSVFGNLKRMRLQHSLIVASEALTFTPGEGATAEGGSPVLLDRTTLAFRRAGLVLSATGQGAIRAPVLLRSRDCAWLSPFAAKPARTVILLEENAALARGGLVWHSERDALDNRWHVLAWPTASLPEAREARTAWGRLLGSYGLRSPRPELVGLRPIDGKPWAIERLALPGRDPAGANFTRLGLRKP
ncbi:MAG: serine/threonine-protein kinase [Gemmataceae bacterium]